MKSPHKPSGTVNGPPGWDSAEWLEAQASSCVTGLSTHSMLRGEVQPMLDRAAAIQQEKWHTSRQ